MLVVNLTNQIVDSQVDKSLIHLLGKLWHLEQLTIGGRQITIAMMTYVFGGCAYESAYRHGIMA